MTLISIPHIYLLEDMKTTYGNDPELQVLLQKWEHKEVNQKYTVRDGLLYFKPRLYVANNARIKAKILNLLHNRPIRSHSGYDKTMQRMRMEFFWLV